MILENKVVSRLKRKMPIHNSHVIENIGTQIQEIHFTFCRFLAVNARGRF